MEGFVELRDRVRAERVREIDASEAGNAAQSRDIRHRFAADRATQLELR